MSAIAGIIRFDRKSQPKPQCEKMLEKLAVYGRDAVGLWAGDAAALGVCKMRALPEDRFDTQPLTDPERGLVLVADARIDNREELRAKLEIDRTAVLQMADADFVMAAFKRWGERCTEHLIGDFAFAVYDSRKSAMFCACDHLAMRPVFYHRGADFFAFASMPQGLLTLPAIPRELDEESLTRHLVLIPEMGTRTFFSGISRLPGAHSVSATAGGLRLHRYWDLDALPSIRLASDGEYVEGFREIFNQAVRCRLRSVGPVGSHLSGGLDSSSVAVTAARILGDAGAILTAFTAVPRPGFEGPEVPGRFGDEGPHAAAAAAMYPNIDHVLVNTEGRSFMDYMERDQRLVGRPIRNPANIVWSDAINEEAHRRGIGTVLTGGWGNVTLSYSGNESLSGLFRSGRWLSLVRESLALMRTGEQDLRSIAHLALRPSLPGWIRRSIEQLRHSEPWRYSPINPDLIEKLKLKPLAEMFFERSFFRAYLNGRSFRNYLLLSTEMGSYSLGLGASAGVDQRDPTGDKRLVEFCLGIPDQQFLHQGVSKRILRRAMAGALPSATLNERRKGLQASDWYERMNASRAQIAEELGLIERSALACRLLDIPRMRALVRNWPKESWQSEKLYTDYALALERGLSTGNFIRCFEAP